MLSYEDTLEFLYDNLPMYQRVGAVAYKEDLTNTIALCEELGNPQYQFKSVHVAGTNGKGSSSHMLAAILQTAGYKTGLYTSPHLKEFTERIRINGNEVSKEFVIDFVERIRPAIARIQPSFFEITVAMAFDYFAKQKVDIAIIEVGLGGRLDSTNVITPLVSMITNISWDHKELLGDTLSKIAGEKAGIIKPKVPVVISERQTEVADVFSNKASATNSKLQLASDLYEVIVLTNGNFQIHNRETGLDMNLSLDLKGTYQRKNVAGVLATIDILRKSGFVISSDHIMHALQNTTTLTGLKGRWQKLSEHPLMICDTGHNEGGIREVVQQIRQQKYNRLWIVLGCVKDKDLHAVLSLLPKEAYYFFCQAKIPRALDAAELMKQSMEVGLTGEVIGDVNQAIRTAKERSGKGDFIFIGGSTFVVAEIDEL
ncbi:MAG: bifunctional folylpolyglutamate synthase/dihydrofolate synthase [Cyclobacteriaceae bacterium]|nr:bifunctional folylpolyglutamate synthase/dihydrofolate synthase [Cyclobacteriaceae bacterium]